MKKNGKVKKLRSVGPSLLTMGIDGNQLCMLHAFLKYSADFTKQDPKWDKKSKNDPLMSFVIEFAEGLGKFIDSINESKSQNVTPMILIIDRGKKDERKNRKTKFKTTPNNKR